MIISFSSRFCVVIVLERLYHFDVGKLGVYFKFFLTVPLHFVEAYISPKVFELEICGCNQIEGLLMFLLMLIKFFDIPMKFRRVIVLERWCHTYF